MNPITHHNLGQMTHREYETRYANDGNTTSYKASLTARPKRVIVSFTALIALAFVAVPLLV